jgi:hypothetical protein
MLLLTLNHSLPCPHRYQNCQDLVFRRAQLKSAKFRPLSREQAAAVAAEARRLHAADDATAQRAHAAAVKGTHFFSALQARTRGQPHCSIPCATGRENLSHTLSEDISQYQLSTSFSQFLIQTQTDG